MAPYVHYRQVLSRAFDAVNNVLKVTISANIKPLPKFTYNATTTSSQAVAANPNRVYLIIINDSDSAEYIAFGETAVVNSGVRLNANGGSYEISEKNGNLTLQAINVIHGGSGNKVVCGVEGS